MNLTPVNKTKLFNDGWKFAKTELHGTYPDDSAFEPIEVPHDWLIFNTLDLYENSIGWYRKVFTKPQADHVLLYFEGVYMDTQVFVNKQLIGEWKYGYSSFEMDITNGLIFETNEILVRVTHQSPNSRWYSGAGIYRNVWLKTRGTSYLPTHGIYLSTSQQEEGWILLIDTQLSLTEPVELIHTLSFQGQILTTRSTPITQQGTLVHTERISVKDPNLWSPSNPSLYELTTSIKAVHTEQRLLDQITQSLGFRKLTFDPDKGFLFNGIKLKLNGVCEHHDLGALGAAFNRQALLRRLRLLKQMGVNAIRTAHNMPAPDLMHLADTLGFFILSEAFDMWELPKTTYDYARFFPDWHKKDLESWVTRDRNHPSLILWSIGNEIYDTHSSPRGVELTRALMEEVYKYDPRQNARVTIGSNYMPWEGAQTCADIVKIAGYNYAEKYYHKHHLDHPDWVIYGSETGSLVQSRGVYHFPLETSILADDDEQCSSLGNSSTSWGARSYECCIMTEKKAQFSLGQFLWTGFDYLGEPTPYHTKNSYFGLLDTATFPKDAYYVFQSAWTDYKIQPMIHVFPYWDFNPGQIIDVRVCSNAPKFTLEFNGQIIGTFNRNEAKSGELLGSWKLPYSPGVLKATAYDDQGTVLATHSRSSFGDPAKLKLVPDKLQLLANGQDLVFLEIGMRDLEDNPVENASNRVSIQVSGEGRLLGLDNGDSTDFDQFKGTHRRLFQGKLMAIIGSTLEPGSVVIKVSSRGMEDQILTLISTPALSTCLEGISVLPTNSLQPWVSDADLELPLRKIELHTPFGQLLEPNNNSFEVEATLFPAHTSYQDVQWSVVHDGGNPSHLAQVHQQNLTACVTAQGDGRFRLRCTSSNGRNKVRLISELEFCAQGFGPANKDPYGFISAGLYDFYQGDVTNGNERGIATSRDGETLVGFHAIDFGPDGSDLIEVPIFALSSEAYSLEIWLSNQETYKNELIFFGQYQKVSRWNVYQSETFKLTKRLRGIHSLCFVTQRKIHIKGFSFLRQLRAYSPIYASEYDQIYGDSYRVTGNKIETIGNNVSIEFHNLNFSDQGIHGLLVNGKSPITNNTIQIRFASQEKEVTQIIEFAYSEDYVERRFCINTLKGQWNLTFIFLPGSNFNLHWFNFY